MLEYATLAAYLTVLLWIGLRAARRVHSSADYTLAGRNIPWVIVLATTAATMIGGGASVGMVSRVFQGGAVWAVVTCAWHLQLILTGLFVAPRLRGLKLVTVADYFQLKFGPLARELATINCLIFLVGALAAQMAAMGTVTNAILGIDYGWALLIGGAVTVFYSTVGGIRAVVSTDVLQFVILVVGIGVASAILFVQSGGYSGMAEQVNSVHFRWTGSLSGTRVASLFFAYLLGETFIPPYAQRCFIARNSKEAKWGVAGGGLFLLLFLPIATLTLGTAAQLKPQVREAVEQERLRILAAHQEAGTSISEEQAAQRAQQVAFPTLVRTTFHPAFAGIMIAAIIAAVMSSADSCLSCLGAVVMEDAYRRHIHREANDRQLLMVAKATTFVAGLAAGLCAWFVRDIATLLEFVYDFWAPSMVLPFAVGLFWYAPRRSAAVVASMIVGMAAACVWRFGLDSPYDIGPALFGCAIAWSTFLVAAPLRPPKPGGWFEPQPMCALESELDEDEMTPEFESGGET